MSAASRCVLALLLASAGAARAADLYGGYSLLRVDGDNAQGAELALSVPLGSTLRLAAEASRQTGLVQGEDLSEWALLAGPLFSPRRGSRLAPFLHAKAGLVRSRRQVEVFGVTIGSAGVCASGCPSETGFAAELGGGLDIRLSQRLGLRLPQVDYRLVRLDGDDARRLRFSAGLLLRFGS